VGHCRESTQLTRLSLLGGKFRDKIRVYNDTALYQRNLPQPKDFAEAATKAKNMDLTR
jgi:galactonate dehydratase